MLLAGILSKSWVSCNLPPDFEQPAPSICFITTVSLSSSWYLCHREEAVGKISLKFKRSRLTAVERLSQRFLNTSLKKPNDVLTGAWIWKQELFLNLLQHEPDMHGIDSNTEVCLLATLMTEIAFLWRKSSRICSRLVLRDNAWRSHRFINREGCLNLLL